MVIIAFSYSSSYFKAFKAPINIEDSYITLSIGYVSSLVIVFFAKANH